MELFIFKHTEKAKNLQGKQLYETPVVEYLGEMADLTSDQWLNSVNMN